MKSARGVFGFLTVVVAIVFSFAGPAHSDTVDQGKPGMQGGWTNTPAPCVKPQETIIVFDGGGSTPCPIVTVAGRRIVTMCNSPKNTGTPLWTVRSDGVAPTTGATPGQVLNKSDCITFAMPPLLVDAGVALNCISDTAGAALTLTECK